MLALLQNYNVIGVLYRGRTVCDDECYPVLGGRAQQASFGPGPLSHD